MNASCGACGSVRAPEGPDSEGVICPRCVTEMFAARFREQRSLLAKEPRCNWAPEGGREGPRSLRERLEDLRELADRSRSSALPPPPSAMGMGEMSLSIRAAIRGVDLFPAGAPAAAPVVKVAAEATRAPPSSRPRPFTFDRVLLAVAVGGSLVMGYKVGEERAARGGRDSQATSELTGKGIEGAARRASGIAASYCMEALAPRADEPARLPVVTVPAPMRPALPASQWKSHVSTTQRSATPPALPEPASAPEMATPAAEIEAEKVPSGHPSSLVEAMAEAVKAKP